QSTSSFGNASICCTRRMRSRRKRATSSLVIFMSNLDLAFQVEDTAPFELDAIAGHAADHLSSATRRLKRAELALVQPRRPIGDQHAVRCAGHGIFRNPLARC